MPRVVREESYDGAVIMEYEDFTLAEKSYMVIGLPDAGLVGGITVSHLVRELSPREVGGIDLARAVPPVVLIKGGEPRPPIRMFLKDDNILMLASEIPLPPAAFYPLSYAILDYCAKRRVDMLVSITGLGSPERIKSERPRPFWAANGRRAQEIAEKLGVERFEDGVLIGPYAVMLKEALRYGLDNVVILVESFPDLPDPEAASVAVGLLGKMLGISVDVSKLLEEAELIRLRTKELMKYTSRMLEQMGKSLEMRPTLLYT
ncbi:MAG: PAC2 family protein [Fervidicoccaceae archaeon]